MIDKHTIALISIVGCSLVLLGALYLPDDLLGGEHGPLRTLNCCNPPQFRTSPVPSVHSTWLQPTEAGLVSSSANLRFAKSLHPTACFPRQAFPYSLCRVLLTRRVANLNTGPFLSAVVAPEDRTIVRKHSADLQVCYGTSRTSFCKYLLPPSNYLR